MQKVGTSTLNCTMNVAVEEQMQNYEMLMLRRELDVISRDNLNTFESNSNRNSDVKGSFEVPLVPCK